MLKIERKKEKALSNFIKEVKEKKFPSNKNLVFIEDDEFEKFKSKIVHK